MLAKKFRLEVENWIKDKAKKVITKKSKFFILKASPNNLNLSRFGAVVSSKTAKNAVKRNYLKRVIFDLVRLEKLYEIPGKDFLITVLPPITKLTKTEIEKELRKILR
jgi:ribonuclease P protein component